MITYDEIEQLSRAKAFKPGSKEYHAVHDFIEYRQRYQRGLTDPIYGLQALDELQRRVDQAVNPNRAVDAEARKVADVDSLDSEGSE